MVVIDEAPVVPRFFVNQGPTLTGPAALVTGIAYEDQPVSPGYAYVRGYDEATYTRRTSYRGYRAAARPVGPSVIRADAEIRTLGSDRIDIRLYRRD